MRQGWSVVVEHGNVEERGAERVVSVTCKEAGVLRSRSEVGRICFAVRGFCLISEFCGVFGGVD